LLNWSLIESVRDEYNGKFLDKLILLNFIVVSINLPGKLGSAIQREGATGLSVMGTNTVAVYFFG